MTSYKICYHGNLKSYKLAMIKLLLFTLWQLGIRSEVYAWLKDCLSGRRLRFRVNNSSSSWLPVTAGVPQASQFGARPIQVGYWELKTLYHLHIAVFADDTFLAATGINEEDCVLKMMEIIQTLLEWTTRWKIEINPQKPDVLLWVGLQESTYQLSWTMSILLGFFLQPDAKWANPNHVPRSSKRLVTMKRYSKKFSRQTLRKCTKLT